MYGKSACTVPLRDRGTTEGMVEILWHRRETRRQTEKTNFSLEPRKAPVYSTICVPSTANASVLLSGIV